MEMEKGGGDVPFQKEQIAKAVQSKYSDLARNVVSYEALQEVKRVLKALGYDLDEVEPLPRTAWEAFTGVGNPISFAGIKKGEKVLDAGCGAGLDSLICAGRVGASGKVVGMDCNNDMLDRARYSRSVVGCKEVEFKKGSIEAIPFDAATFDAVISNGVANLCPDKDIVFAEFYRVLKTGGRLAISDVVRRVEVGAEQKADIKAWTS